MSRPSRASRPTRSVVLLRQVPGDTVVHRLWAGTKLLSVTALVGTACSVPSWAAAGCFAALLVVVARLARIPRGAVPRPPAWFGLLMLLGALLTLAAGGRPEVSVAGAHLGLGDLELYVRFTCLATLLLAASAMVTWTTPLGELAPAFARLAAPLRRLHLPVDEWAVTISLTVRSLPLLFEELRVLLAARRLRPAPDRAGGALEARLDEGIDILTAALAASLRRAGEVGEAITARGGAGQLAADPAGPHRRDAVALAVVAAACGAVIALNVA